MKINKETNFVEAEPDYFLVNKENLLKIKQLYLSDLSFLDQWEEMTQWQFDRFMKGWEKNQSLQE